MHSARPSDWPDIELALLQALAAAPRGPRRQNLFAVWLLARTARDMLEPGWASERAQRRRVSALGERLSSLSLSAPLRRALSASIHHLGEPSPDTARMALHQMLAPARESAGPEAAAALQFLLKSVPGA